MMKPNNIERVACDHETWRNIRWYCQQKEIYFIAGLSTFYVPKFKQKFLLLSRPDGAKVCQIWPDLSNEQVLMSPGEAARTELKRQFPNVKRVGWQRQHVSLFDWRWPMYCQGPVKSEQGVYIDLKGAYHSLYSRLWLDTAFPNGYGTLDLQPIGERLQNWKAARNSLLGIVRSRSSIGVIGFRQIEVSTQNQFLAPHLWAQVQAILNDVARVAVKRGCVYVATDGYLFKRVDDALWFEEKLIDWNLPYRVSKGELDIQSWMAYRIGKKKTKLYNPDNPRYGSSFSAIAPPDRDSETKHIDWWAYGVTHYRDRQEKAK